MRSQRKALVVSLVATLALALIADSADARRGPQRRQRQRISQKLLRTQQQQPGAKPAFASFKQFAQQTQMPHAVHNGKLFIAVDKTKLQQNYDAYTKIGGGKVLEFSGTGHLHTRHNGKKDVHFLFGSLYPTGTFSAPTGKRVSAVVKLTDAEHREFNAYLDAASVNAKNVIGKWNYNGGRPKRYHGGSGAANCTSWISTAKLDGSRTLGQTCGVWGSVSPTSWINSLARSGNSRVEAVMLHGFTGDVNNRVQIDAFIRDNMKH